MTSSYMNGLMGGESWYKVCKYSWISDSIVWEFIGFKFFNKKDAECLFLRTSNLLISEYLLILF